MLTDKNGKSVHYPSDPHRFAFDAEVSAIFPEMAVRSIPMYAEVHRAMASTLSRRYGDAEFSVLDVGASRGDFGAILREYAPSAHLVAVDNSPHMCEYLKTSGHYRAVLCEDFRHKAVSDHGPYDAVAAFYVFQFMPVDQQADALRRAYSLLKPGGILLLGQKEVPSGRCWVGDSVVSEYIEFRLRNGYSMDEITAKTKALGGSMWPRTAAWTKATAMDVGFARVYDITRWMNFASYICVK